MQSCLSLWKAFALVVEPYLRRQLINDAVLPGLRQRDVEDDDQAENQRHLQYFVENFDLTC